MDPTAKPAGGPSTGEPLLSDAEILERMPFYESTDTDPSGRAWHAEVLVDYCRGGLAEKAIRAVVQGLPLDALEPLVSKHVIRWATPPGHPGYCRDGHVVAQRLVAHGFSPVRTSGDGYEVGWAGGELVTGADLCRIALLAVWLRRMRETEPKGIGPSY